MVYITQDKMCQWRKIFWLPLLLNTVCSYSVSQNFAALLFCKVISIQQRTHVKKLSVNKRNHTVNGFFTFSLPDKCEQESIISSIEKELELLSLEAEQLSKKTSLREKQLDDAKKQNIQEEQGKLNFSTQTLLM